MSPTSPRVILFFVFLGTGVFAQYDQCTGNISSIGDARCDDGYNNAECEYDGGDCCYCSCVDGPDYTCGIVGFDCQDPEYMGAEISDCDEDLTVVAPCSPDASTQRVVNDTASATALADALHCSGGVFSVQWVGSVNVSQTIEVTHGTVLRVAGVRPEAAMQAATGIRLFTVINASLELRNMAIAGGSATFGGAIAAAGSSLLLENTSFAGNVASIEGGALYATLGSIASFGEGTLFDGNHAGAQGGALSFEGASSVAFHQYTSFSHRTTNGFGGMLPVPSSTAFGKGANIVSSDTTNSSDTVPSGTHPETYGFRGVLQLSPSNVSWSSDAVFINNTADGSGGALYVYSSYLSWPGDAVFSDNTAHGSGGALFVYSSYISWSGDAVFSDNAAHGSGGALDVSFSDVSWSGDAVFFDNTADDSGGALDVSFSDVSWSGDAEISNNTAHGSGGALYVDSSNVSWSGDAVFSNNTADDDGGALRVSFSNMSWSGDAEFSNNTAEDSGATLYISNSDMCWSGDSAFSNNTAGGLGGALYGYASSLSWSGDVVFSNNTAADDGGALRVFNSSVSLSGDAEFSYNNADDDGGALHIESSVVSWSGHAVFFGNTANDLGAALYIESSVVSWSGDGNFSNNTAGGSAGALYVSSSDVSWLGDAVFSNNIAGGSAGALRVLFSTVLWSGDAAFSDNTAEDDGGALYFWVSDVYWSGDALFSYNTASGHGGALYVYDSVVSWSGDAVLSNNIAYRSGGALRLNSSDVFWSGDGVFSYNTAGGSGGALYFWSSNVSWSGDSVFSNNTADGSGGALAVSSSNVYWSGDAEFSYNTADGSGGALSAPSSNLRWTCNVVIFDNSANGNGGAFHITDGARVVFELGILLLRNSASGDGGAVFIYGKNDAQRSSLSVNRNVVFHKNACRGDGGALAVVAAGEVHFTTTNVTFSQNSAHVAGGAVAVKGAGIGPRFTGVTFVSNQAQIGGATYITSSGTITTENASGVQMQHPTTFDRCMFVGNEAGATGGAIDTGAGLDMIANTSFARNIARAGGALKLAGITSLVNCTFTENTSESGEGPAVANTGFVSSMTECSFVDNAFKCDPGEFLDYEETRNSSEVLDVVCKGCDGCDSCTTFNRVPSCSKELEHTRSDGGNATVEALKIDAGYWRATKTSRKVLKCFNANACVGGITGASNYCSAGYEGPYCSTCRDGFSPSLDYVCNKCSGGSGSGVAVAAIVAISAILVVVLVLRSLIRGKSTGASRRLLASWRRRLLSLKIIIIVWQITTQFTSLTSFRYPDVYQRYLNAINIVNFDIGRILAMECIVNLDFHNRLLISTLGPAGALAALGALYAVHGRVNRPSYHDSIVAVREESRQTYVSMVLLLTFLVYSSVSSSLFQTFACDKLDDGNSYLRADYRIDCNSSTHRSLQVYAVFMMVFYTAGIPVFYGVLLFRNRHVLMNESTRQQDAAAKSISSLWKLYKPHRFYYELIECARRILLAGVVVFIFPDTAAQVGIALMIATIFMVFSEMMAPYESLWDAWINRIGHAIVFGTIYLALLMKIDISNEKRRCQHVFAVIIISVQACMVLLVVSEGIVVTYRWIKRSR